MLRGRGPLALALVGLGILLGSCGSSDSTAPTAAEALRSHRDSESGSKQFLLKGGDNSIQQFGAEAGTAERETATAALHGFLDARAADRWAAACRYAAAELLRSLRQALTGSGSQAGASCAVLLEGLSAGVPARNLREAAAAEVGSLRVQGARGYLLYRGLPRGTIYAIPMLREGDAWKVAALAGTALN